MEFGDKCLTDSMRLKATQMVSNLNQQLEMRNAEIKEDEFVTRQIHPILHSFFVELVSVASPGGSNRHQSMGTLFMAFSQINYQGQWKPVKFASIVPSQLRYCIRCVIFYDYVLRGSYDVEVMVHTKNIGKKNDVIGDQIASDVDEEDMNYLD